ncbi:MAG: hypothetical protein HY822_21875 [Acidobacteria bacterium]|nr:hypothetical protein [Acidobacteriota bacterium]
MPGLTTAENALWWGNTIVSGLLVWRLWSAGLHRTYPFLAAFWAFSILRTAALRLVDPVRMAYGWIWLLSEPLVWLLTGCVVFELSTLALRDYRGLDWLSRRILLWGLLLCVAVSAGSVLVDFTHSPGDFPVLLAVNLARRAVLAAVALFLPILAGFLLWFPVPVARNLLSHAVLMSVYSMGLALSVFVRNLFGPSVVPRFNTAHLAMSLLCLLGWLSLSPAGERRPAVMRLRWRRETERRLLDQLAALNASLSRSAGNPG